MVTMFNYLFGAVLLFLAFRLYQLRRVDQDLFWLAGFAAYMGAMDICQISVTADFAGAWLVALGYLFKAGYAVCCVIKLLKCRKKAASLKAGHSRRHAQESSVIKFTKAG